MSFPNHSIKSAQHFLTQPSTRESSALLYGSFIVSALQTCSMQGRSLKLEYVEPVKQADSPVSLVRFLFSRICSGQYSLEYLGPII